MRRFDLRCVQCYEDEAIKIHVNVENNIVIDEEVVDVLVTVECKSCGNKEIVSYES